jgi:hypothetical protein
MQGKGLVHLSLAFRFPRHTVTATVINLIVT